MRLPSERPDYDAVYVAIGLVFAGLIPTALGLHLQNPTILAVGSMLLFSGMALLGAFGAFLYALNRIPDQPMPTASVSPGRCCWVAWPSSG